MIWRSLTLLLVIVCCTSKPDVGAPGNPVEGGPELSFSGLEGALKHNVPFEVNVTVEGDVSVSTSSDATQALTIGLSQRAGTGAYEKVTEKPATNNSATFELTLSSGSYTLKAETTGVATLSKESSAFTVSTANTVDEIDGIKLSFSEDSYTIKSGALFDVTIDVTESGKLDAGSHVTLALLKDDGNPVEGLMQWQTRKQNMLPLGGAIKAVVDTDDGKAEFKDLFIVDDSDVAELQAVLEYEGKLLGAVTEFKSDKAEVTLDDIILDNENNSISNFNFNPDTISKDLQGDNTSHRFSLYFFQANSNPPVITGPQAGSAVPHNIDKNVADFYTHCYDIAVRLSGSKDGAFWHSAAKSFSGPPRCKQ